MKTICGCEIEDGTWTTVTCQHGRNWHASGLTSVEANGHKPTIVCLCGSTRFWKTFQVASLEETLIGKIVLSIGAASGTDDEHFGNLPKEEYDRIKEELDVLHFRKIDLADEVLILNVSGYIGESTARELAYARATGKRIRFLEREDEIIKAYYES